jgi:tRNA-modifying protein YgfZ
LPEFPLQRMNTPSERSLVSLDDLGVIRVQGADARSFLQGQLSNDLTRLSAERSLLAGYHNPQGRTIALLRLLWLSADDFIAVLPRELAPTVAARLRKFVLRAQVKIADQSATWRVLGLTGPEAVTDALSAAGTPAGVAHARVGSSPSRWLIVAPAELPIAQTTGERRHWHRLDIASGQAQVFAATSEEFVAQMLNLDVLDAISFAKGCYTGQEVIARAHYRGRVKRRLQRFVTRAPRTLAPGEGARLADGRSFRVVDAVQLDDGRCEFLAVAPLLAQGAQPDAEGAASGELMLVDAEPLPLPYSLPE